MLIPALFIFALSIVTPFCPLYSWSTIVIAGSNHEVLQLHFENSPLLIATMPTVYSGPICIPNRIREVEFSLARLASGRRSCLCTQTIDYPREGSNCCNCLENAVFYNCG